MTDRVSPNAPRRQPFLLVWPTREYRPGTFVTVDGEYAVIRKVLMDTGTVLRAVIDVYDSAAAREEACRA